MIWLRLHVNATIKGKQETAKMNLLCWPNKLLACLYTSMNFTQLFEVGYTRYIHVCTHVSVKMNFLTSLLPYIHLTLEGREILKQGLANFSCKGPFRSRGRVKNYISRENISTSFFIDGIKKKFLYVSTNDRNGFLFGG